MKPKDLLAELEKNRGDDYNNGVYDGAKMMREAYLEDGRQRMAKHKAAHLDGTGIVKHHARS